MVKEKKNLRRAKMFEFNYEKISEYDLDEIKQELRRQILNYTNNSEKIEKLKKELEERGE